MSGIYNTTASPVFSGALPVTIPVVSPLTACEKAPPANSSRAMAVPIEAAENPVLSAAAAPARFPAAAAVELPTAAPATAPPTTAAPAISRCPMECCPQRSV